MGGAVPRTSAVRQVPRRAQPARRRVRHEAKDALAVAAFSAVASTVLALAATVVLALVG